MLKISASGQLTSPYWTITVSSVPILRRRCRDGAASSTLLPVTCTGTIIYLLHQLYRPSTHVVLSGVDRGHDTPPPPRPGMTEREREREHSSIVHMHRVLYAVTRPPSVCPPCQLKTVRVRIMTFSPYSNPIPLVFAIHKF